MLSVSESRGEDYSDEGLRLTLLERTLLWVDRRDSRRSSHGVGDFWISINDSCLMFVFHFRIQYFGGTFGGLNKPTKFLCLVLKMLQLQPEKEVRTLKQSYYDLGSNPA